MKKISTKKSDILIVKSFIQQPEPKFVRKLALEMNIDYLVGLCMRFIDKDSSLSNKLVDFDIEIKKKINTYINKYGDNQDRIFHEKMEEAYLILTKYYSEDGLAKKQYFK